MSIAPVRQEFTVKPSRAPTRVLALVCGLAVLLGQPAATAAYAWDYGRSSAPDGFLWPGCRDRMIVAHYDFNPPTSQWSAEFFLEDSTGQGVAANAVDSSEDPARGQVPFGFCSSSTQPGPFVIRTRFTYKDFWDPDGVAVWLRPARLRLERPGTRSVLLDRHRARSMHQTRQGWAPNRRAAMVVRAREGGRWHTIRHLTTNRRGYATFTVRHGVRIRVETVRTTDYRRSVSRALRS